MRSTRGSAFRRLTTKAQRPRGRVVLDDHLLLDANEVEDHWRPLHRLPAEQRDSIEALLLSPAMVNVPTMLSLPHFQIPNSVTLHENREAEWSQLVRQPLPRLSASSGNPRHPGRRGNRPVAGHIHAGQRTTAAER